MGEFTTWLPWALAIAAIPPGWYVWRYLAEDPSRGDVTLPRRVAAWRTRPRLIVSLSALSLIVLIAVVAVAPRSDPVTVALPEGGLPLLLGGAALGGYALFTVVRGFARGAIEPLARGFSRSYSRTGEPRRFWASLIYNGLIGGVAVGAAIASLFPSTRDQCLVANTAFTPEQIIAACDRFLESPDLDTGDRSAALAQRGYRFQRAGRFASARQDYDEAIRLDPTDSYSLFNRALIFDGHGDQVRALADYTASLKLRPENAEALFYRGLIHGHRQQHRLAIDDFSNAHRLQPSNVWPIANRAFSYVLLRDDRRARADLALVDRMTRSNYVALHARAVLSDRAGDPLGAIRDLDAAIASNPRDDWSRDYRERLRRQLATITRDTT